MKAPSSSSLVNYWSAFINTAARLSWFALVPRRWDTHRFVEGYVTVWTAAALANFTLLSSIGNYPGAYIVSIVAGVRIFEIVIYHLKVLTVGGPSTLGGYRRSFILFIMNYVEVIAWFASYYTLLAATNRLGVAEPAFLAIIRESIVSMVGNSGSGFSFSIPSRLAWLIWTIHAAIGLFMTLVMLSRTISLLGRPETSDPQERAEYTSPRFERDSDTAA